MPGTYQFIVLACHRVIQSLGHQIILVLKMRTQDSGDIGLPEAIQAGGAGPTTRPQSLDLRPGRSPSTPCTDPPIPKAVGEHSKCDVDDGELG